MMENKLFVVILVLLIILAGITLFLINMDRRTRKLEKEVREQSLLFGSTDKADKA